jgi:hypothetical protein
VKRIVVIALGFAVVALASAPAQAALIRVTPTGFTPAEYEAAGYPTDPAIIGGSGFRLTYWGDGNDTLVNPVMMVFGIPDLSMAAPGVTVGDKAGFDEVKVDLGDTQTRYGGSWDTTTGLVGTFSSSTTSKVYDYIGFTPKGSSSENYTNWNGATGITSWNLFVYAVTFNPVVGHGDYVEFSTSLPVGSYVIGYGCEALKNGLCSGSGDTESTPFTFAGLVSTPPTTVPEPSTLTLLVPGIAFALARIRRASRLECPRP